MMAWPHQSVEYWLTISLLANKNKIEMRPTRETIDDFVGNILTTIRSIGLIPNKKRKLKLCSVEKFY